MRSRAAAVPAALLLLVVGCTDSGSGSSSSSSSDDEATSAGTASSPVAAEPDGGLTVVADEDPVAQAVSTSRALFETLAGRRAGPCGRPGRAAPGRVGRRRPRRAAAGRAGRRRGSGAGRRSWTGSAPTSCSPSARPRAPGRRARGAVAYRPTSRRSRRPPAWRWTRRRPVADGRRRRRRGRRSTRRIRSPCGPRTTRRPADGDDVGGAAGVRARRPARGPWSLLAGDDASPAAVATARAAGARVVPMTGGRPIPARRPTWSRRSRDEARRRPWSRWAPDFAAEEGLDWKLATAATGTAAARRRAAALPGPDAGGALRASRAAARSACWGSSRSTRRSSGPGTHAAPYEPLVERARRPGVRDHRDRRLGVRRGRTATTPTEADRRDAAAVGGGRGRGRALRRPRPAAGPHRLRHPGRAVPLAAGAAARRAGPGPGVAARARTRCT